MDRLRKILKELKTSSSNIENSKMIVLQDDDLLMRLCSTNCLATHNVLKTRAKLINGANNPIKSIVENAHICSSPTDKAKSVDLLQKQTER